MFWEYSKLITALIGIAGGSILMFAAFRSRSSAAGWSKKIVFFAGLSALISGILRMIKIYYGSSLTARQLELLEHNKTLLGGLTLGFLITLFVSGEFSLKKWGKKPNNE